MTAQGIVQTLQNVRKTISTPTYTNPSTLTLVRENLAPEISRLVNRETPLRDRLTRRTGSGLAASWNVLTSITNNNASFAEGGTPTENNASYTRRSAVYKELGKKKSITDKMLAAGASFTDQEAEQTEVAMLEVIQDEERLIIQGDATGTPVEFDGLNSLISTNITNDNNNALGFRTDLIDAEVANLLTNFGVKPTAIICSYNMKRAINQSLAGDIRVNLNQGNEVGHGIDVTFYQSAIGKLPIIPTFAVADDSSTYSGNTVSDIYLITETAFAQPVLYMEDLYPIGKSMLDRTGAAINFMVTEATVLVCRAEEMQVRIRNVRVS